MNFSHGIPQCTGRRYTGQARKGINGFRFLTSDLRPACLSVYSGTLPENGLRRGNTYLERDNGQTQERQNTAHFTPPRQNRLSVRLLKATSLLAPYLFPAFAFPFPLPPCLQASIIPA